MPWGGGSGETHPKIIPPICSPLLIQMSPWGCHRCVPFQEPPAPRVKHSAALPWGWGLVQRPLPRGQLRVDSRGDSSISCCQRGGGEAGGLQWGAEPGGHACAPISEEGTRNPLGR